MGVFKKLTEFLLHPANISYSSALLMVAVITVIEMFSMLLGFAFSDAVDAIMPDFEIDVDMEMDIGSHFWGWLGLGRIPFLIILVSILTTYGLSGLLMHSVLQDLSLLYELFTIITAPISCIISLFITAKLSNMLAKVLSKDQEKEITPDDFIGSTGKITLGSLKQDMPAEVCIELDGRTHYVMAKSAEKRDIPNESKVMLVGKENESIFLAVAVD